MIKKSRTKAQKNTSARKIINIRKGKNNMPASIDYQKDLIERLKNHDYATVYLNAAFKESLHGDKESLDVFFEALKNVAQAQGATNELKKRARIEQKNVIDALSRKKINQIQSFATLINSMGFEIRFY